METLLLAADDPDATGRAVDALCDGELVALPTETVYGLAADIRCIHAVAGIFEAKDRPLFDPLIVHLPGRGWLERVTIIPPSQRKLVERLTESFWPGPLTILLPRRIEEVPDLVTAGSDLVAVRMSAHPVFRQVIEPFGHPLAAPSANRFGRISPTTGAHVLSELEGRVPLILDAGPTEHGLESTVVALGPGGTLSILRHGPVTAEMLAGFAILEAQTHSAERSAPGQTPGHYAPRTPLILLEENRPPSVLGNAPGARLGLLALRRDRPCAPGAYEHVEYLSDHGDLKQAATLLFAALRRLDEARLDEIVAEPVPGIGLGRAIMERLRRAAAGSGGSKDPTRAG